MSQASGPMDWMFQDDPVRCEYHNAHVETARWSRHDAHWQEWDWLRRKAAAEKNGMWLIRPGYVTASEGFVVQPMFKHIPLLPIFQFHTIDIKGLNDDIPT